MSDPFAEFRALLARAEATDRALIPEPTAMTLATVGADGAPSARIVLLKGLDERGFVFYTNQQSRKGRDIAAHPAVALVFHWQPLERQVRIEGKAERVTDAEADSYFASRARDSQIGAWASQQSETLASDDTLRDRVQEMERRFAGREVPRPPHWSGYRVIPTRLEFWSGRPHRLHERRLFERSGNGWAVRRLFP